ncbi:MAG: OmcA/MtrC family decaheme c-type cytochrome, partial [Gammaproteobacteria bacterium]|nr:OmcA/MtrC family decaheme c-type cytochrome [Gammaproteobacteria bacterium]
AVGFTIARLTPGADGNSSAWQSYINITEQAGSVGPGTEDKLQATTENGALGTLSDHGDGRYSYSFATDVTAVPGVPYEPSLTHRVGLEIRGFAPVANPVYTFRPADGATTGIFGREIVSDAACNRCHENLSLHGGARFQHQYCVTCHNPGSADANSGNTVDETVMIHKIHRGAGLPSVLAGGEYALWGFLDRKHDYSSVIYPQDIRNCRNCHDESDPATPEAGNWIDVPTIEACGSCHDDVDFATGTNHATGIPAGNSDCGICHDRNSPASADRTHRIPEQDAARAFRFNLLGVSATAPGQFPVVRFSVTDPTRDDAFWDIRADAPFTTPSSSAVNINIAWNTIEISNAGSGSSGAPGQPVRIDALATATANGDGSYNATAATAIPGDITGSGVVGLEGRAALDVAGSSSPERIPITNASAFFLITDPAPVPRRQVVDLARCNDCHQSLSLHGANRTDDIVNCLTCHTANATDIAKRVQAGVDGSNAPDGKREESIEMKYMTHALHAGTVREGGYIVYDFFGAPVDFSAVVYPGRLATCTGCHRPGSYYPVGAFALGTTIDSGADRASPLDDTRITPNTSACFGCHDRAAAVAHMEQNGGAFDAAQTAEGILVSAARGTVIETCDVCHGPGRIADTAAIHGLQ